MWGCFGNVRLSVVTGSIEGFGFHSFLGFAFWLAGIRCVLGPGLHITSNKPISGYV